MDGALKQAAPSLMRRFAHSLRHEFDLFYFFARNPLKNLNSKK